MDKRRSAHNVSEVMNLIGDVRGKVAVLVDDMIDTAGAPAIVSPLKHCAIAWGQEVSVRMPGLMALVKDFVKGWHAKCPWPPFGDIEGTLGACESVSELVKA